ncbi:hypothetical protein OEA41_001530 [Lepraria neglecta]|uniref:AA9 family lytic polysaccharide monooxygenase n=1 Tax=Lepraria neglecta TaxID=209136 RepID=A0AAE0DLL0_9LECA|nr:hypothetical protein OEA41_001530 [Lepraria neglecta]
MHFSQVKILLVAAGAVHLTNAHTTFTNFFVDGVDQGDGTAVRMSNNIQQATYPLPNVTTPDMACGVNGETGVARIASVNAGSRLTFEYRAVPDVSTVSGGVSIDPNHKGPCAIYMKKVTDSSASNNAAGDGWFKIMEDGYDSVAGKWCTEKLIPNDGHLSATVPSDLAPGYYLVRPELLALHQADKTPPDPQFYVGCAQIFLNSSGSATPPNTVAIPGYVNMSTSAMTYDIWTVPLKLPFPDFGPPLYTGSSSKRSIEARAMNQTIGLKPEGCVMENVNWCGFMPASYTDQSSCYQTSQNCSVQATDCYNAAGPTGSKNCFNWEDFCTAIHDDCGSSLSCSGPPSISSYMPGSLERLDQSKVAAASGPMPSSASLSGSNPAAPMQSYGAEPASAPPSAVIPGSSRLTGYITDTGSLPTNGSIDMCGSKGDQTCAEELCYTAVYPTITAARGANHNSGNVLEAPRTRG